MSTGVSAAGAAGGASGGAAGMTGPDVAGTPLPLSSPPAAALEPKADTAQQIQLTAVASSDAAAGPYSYPPQPQGSVLVPGYPISQPAVGAPTHAGPTSATAEEAHTAGLLGEAPVGGTSTPAGVVTTGQVEPWGCSAGWVLFGLGFIFPPCWVAGTFLPCCSTNRNNGRAGIANAVAFVLSLLLGIILAGVLGSAHRQRHL